MYNFDMIGYKDTLVEFMEFEGLPKKAVSPFLNGLAREMANECGYNVSGLYLPTGAATVVRFFTSYIHIYEPCSVSI